MLLNVPYTHAFFATKNQGGRMRQRDIWEMSEVEITEVTAMAAPIVMTWNDSPPFPSAWSSVASQDDHIVYCNGSLWSLLHEGDNTPLADHGEYPALTPVCLLDNISRNGYSELFFVHGYLDKSKKEASSRQIDLSDYAIVTSSNREYKLNDLRGRADKLLIRDGVVYERCEDIHYIVRSLSPLDDPSSSDYLFYISASPKGSLTAPFMNQTETIDGRRRFHLDEFDHLLEIVTQRNAGRNGAEDAFRFNESKRVTIVDSRYYDPEVARIKTLSSHVYLSLFKYSAKTAGVAECLGIVNNLVSDNSWDTPDQFVENEASVEEMISILEAEGICETVAPVLYELRTRLQSMPMTINFAKAFGAKHAP